MENEYLLRFGGRVRELRLAAGLSQEKFALAIGMDRTYLSSVETGKRNISLLNIHKIAQGLGVPAAELFRENGCERGDGA